MDDLTEIAKRKQKTMTDCMNELANLRRKTDTNDFRKWNYDVAALVILAGYRALAIEDSHVMTKINTSSGYDYIDGTLTINEDEEHKTFAGIICTDSNGEDEKNAEYAMRDSLLAPALTEQGHEVRYCSLNYDYWNGIEDMTYEEAKGCAYDFLYHNDKPEESHSIRIEKMIQFYEYKDKRGDFILFKMFITLLLNYICDNAEKGECVQVGRINKQLIGGIGMLGTEKNVLEEDRQERARMDKARNVKKNKARHKKKKH